MNPALFKETTKVFKRISSGESSRSQDLELEIHKKILNIFQVGDFYYFIFDIKALKFDVMSKEVKQVLGYNPEDLDLTGLLEKIHPEDYPWFLNFESKVGEFFSTLSLEQIPNYKVRYDYRVRKSDGAYIRILQQVISIDYDGNGHVFRTLVVHTDISHLKTEGVPVLSFIGLNGHPSFIDVAAEKLFKPTSFLSPREREVLLMLADGKKSKEIASRLFISIDTVNTHRKKILAKTGALNTVDLIRRATRDGWI